MSLSLLSVLTLSAVSTSDTDLFQAIRSDDLMALRAAVESGADLSASGPLGGTPLHDAVALGSPEAVSILIQGGAAVDGRSTLHATPLHWANGDYTKTRLLVEAGADVNARSKSGRTPLIVAAARNGGAAAVRLLLEHRADPILADDMGMTPLLAAAMADDLLSVRLLLDRGGDDKQADKAGFTPLHYAAGHNNLPMVELLLSRGAPVDAPNIFGGAVKHGEVALKGLTPLMLAAPAADAEVVEALLDAGADVNARDSRRMTPLMLAVASEHSSPQTIKLLLSRQADVEAVSEAGESALDWALKFADPSVLHVLERFGAEPHRPAPHPAEAPVESERTARQAAEAGLALAQRASESFYRESGCVGCHHQNMTQIAVSAARGGGLAFDQEQARRSVEATAAQWSIFAPALLERLDAPGTPDTPTFSLFSLALSQHPADAATDALFVNILAQQRRDGSWRMAGFSRPPMEESSIARTAMAVRALEAYAPAGRRLEMEDSVRRAGVWLLEAKPQTTDEYVWRLLGLKWTGQDAKEVRRAARKLLDLQSKDGSWAPAGRLDGDVYATATALWALRTSGMLKAEEEAYRRGGAYLIGAQQQDGSWKVRSRASKFQPYFESGFPHGGDQWISAAATSWAVAALAAGN